MTGSACCPRCGLNVRPPGRHADAWQCGTHGAVTPVRLYAPVTAAAAGNASRDSDVPLWLPWPSPPEWAITGLALAGGSDRPARAAAVALTGPAPLGGMAELVLVAEEPGTGLGAGYAALAGTDPGAMPDHTPDATVRAGGHVARLWLLPSTDDRCVYVGESMGCWLWVVLWPAQAGLLLLEDLVLHDLRDDLPGQVRFGPPSPYLRPGSGPDDPPGG